jgi:Spy/CpxP family protein refolding chaperone
MKKFVIALAIAATGSMAFAGEGASGHRRGAAHFEQFAQRLGLSDAQKQQISDIHKADFDKNKQLYSDFRSKREEYRQLRDANDPRAAQVKSELEALKDQVKAARKATHEQILNVLTPQQRKQLEQWRAERGQRQRD